MLRTEDKQEMAYPHIKLSSKRKRGANKLSQFNVTNTTLRLYKTYSGKQSQFHKDHGNIQ